MSRHEGNHLLDNSRLQFLPRLPNIMA